MTSAIKIPRSFLATARSFLALPIRVHLFLLVLLAVLPALASILYLGVKQRAQVYARARHEAVETANITALVLARKTENAMQLLITLAHLNEVRTDPSSLSPLLAELMQNHHDYINILIADKLGNVVASAVQPAIKNVGDRKYFREAMSSGGLAVGEYSVGRIINQPTFHFAYPVKDNRGKAKAVVACAISLKSFGELFDGAGLPEGSSLVLDDHRGTVIFASAPHSDYIGKSDLPQMVSLLSAGEEQGFVEGPGFYGDKRILGYKRLRLSPGEPPYLLVRVGIAPGRLIEEVNEVIRICLLLVGGACLLAIVSFWLLGNMLVVRRLKKLLYTANSIKRGDLQTRTCLDPALGEIGRLGEAFDDMAAALEERERARKLAKRELVEEKERLAVTLSSIGDGVITTDEQGRVMLMNQVAEEYTGFPLKEAQKRALSEIVQLQSEVPGRQLSLPAISNVPSRGKLISRQGTERLVSSLAAPIRDNDMVLGTVLVLRDITAENRVQEELQRSAKLESIGVMAGGIAHDFNNLLTAICGNLSIIQMTLGESCSAKASRLLKGIETAIGRARELTQQLLTFSKGGAPVKRTLDLNKLVGSSAEFILSGSAHTLELHSSSELWPVEADEGQLNQVINNLVINAVQAMQTGGTIAVNLSNFMADGVSTALKPGPYVKVSVADQGEGVATENLSRIFDPFFSTKSQGTGLGLTSAYSIVRAHGGKLEVEKTSSQGSTFSFYIPAVPRAKVDETELEPLLLDIAGKRILVMDDEPILRTMLVDMLRLAGHKAVAVSNGDEALSCYQEQLRSGQPFDLVILDLTIRGGLGGKETMRRLLEIDSRATGVASSGYSTDTIMSDYKNFGFAGRLAKPFSMEELKRVIAEVTTRRAEAAIGYTSGKK